MTQKAPLPPDPKRIEGFHATGDRGLGPQLRLHEGKRRPWASPPPGRLDWPRFPPDPKYTTRSHHHRGLQPQTTGTTTEAAGERGTFRSDATENRAMAGLHQRPATRAAEYAGQRRRQTSPADGRRRLADRAAAQGSAGHRCDPPARRPTGSTRAPRSPPPPSPASARALPAAVSGGGKGRKGDEGRQAAIDGIAPESPQGLWYVLPPFLNISPF